MHFFRQIVVLIVIFASGECADFPRHFREAITPSRFEKGQCWAHMVQLNTVMRQATCKPRDTMVEVTSEVANIVIYPNKVAVKRCDGGSCYGQSSCLPTSVKKISIAVRQHDFQTGREVCGFIKMEEHTSCTCGCSVMASHCSPMQHYKYRECACECSNSVEKEICLQQILEQDQLPDPYYSNSRLKELSEKIWDPSTCSCKCKEMYPDCSTGTEWVPSMCRCMRIIMEDQDFSPEFQYNNYNIV